MVDSVEVSNWVCLLCTEYYNYMVLMAVLVVMIIAVVDQVYLLLPLSLFINLVNLSNPTP